VAIKVISTILFLESHLTFIIFGFFVAAETLATAVRMP